MSMIPVMLPDMPSTEELLPWLKKIDDNCWYSNFGPLNTLFCEQVKSTFADADQLSVASIANATAGLEIILQTLNLPKQSHILIPSLTFVATATAVMRANFTPLVSDIDPQNWLLTPVIAEEILKKQPFSAVMPVAAFGCPQDVQAWDDFTKRTGIPVIIDAAGAYGNQTVGKTTMVVFSMHATKCLGGGEGGLILCRDADLIEKIRVYSNFGMGSTPGCRTIYTPGTNAKLSEYHAAVCLASLERFSARAAIRRKLYQHYLTHLAEIAPYFSLQAGTENTIKSLFIIRLTHTNQLAEIMNSLLQANIQTLRWYYPPIHQHPGFSACTTAGSLTHIENISTQLLGLPFHPFLSNDNIEYICQSLKKAYIW